MRAYTALIGLLLSLLLLSGCATKPRSELKQREDILGTAYLDCLQNSANRYSSSQGTPSEIAEASLAECEHSLEMYRQALENYLKSRVSTRRGQEYANQQSFEMAQFMRDRGRGFVIGIVLKKRK